MSAIALNSIPFPYEPAPSPLEITASQTLLHRRRGVKLGMPLVMPSPQQFGYQVYSGAHDSPSVHEKVQAATAAAAVFNIKSSHVPSSNDGRPATSGLFGSSASASNTFWTPASAAVGTKGPLQPHVSNLPRRKTTRRKFGGVEIV